MPQQDSDFGDFKVGRSTRRRTAIKLSDYEKSIIARRAYGEYAIIEVCEQIWRLHNKKNRHPEDQVYLDFLRTALRRSLNSKELEKVSAPVIDRHPDPWNLSDYIAHRRGHSNETFKKKDLSTGLFVDDDGLNWLPSDWKI